MECFPKHASIFVHNVSLGAYTMVRRTNEMTMNPSIFIPEKFGKISPVRRIIKVNIARHNTNPNRYGLSWMNL